MLPARASSRVAWRCVGCCTTLALAFSVKPATAAPDARAAAPTRADGRGALSRRGTALVVRSSPSWGRPGHSSWSDADDKAVAAPIRAARHGRGCVRASGAPRFSREFPDRKRTARDFPSTGRAGQGGDFFLSRSVAGSPHSVRDQGGAARLTRARCGSDAVVALGPQAAGGAQRAGRRETAARLLPTRRCRREGGNRESAEGHSLGRAAKTALSGATRDRGKAGGSAEEQPEEDLSIRRDRRERDALVTGARP